MQRLNFPIIDPHIHQWDPYHTPHSAALLVKVFGHSPYLMDKIVRIVKPKDLIDTLGITKYALAPYLPHDFKADNDTYKVESVVHIEASWHHQKGFGVVEETDWINQLPFEEQGIKLGAIIGTADPRHKKFKDILKAHVDASPVFRGIRKMAAWHSDSGVHRWTDKAELYRSKKFLKGFEILASMNLSFDAWVYSHQIKDVTYLAKQFPDTPIMLDHLATPVGMFGKVGKRTGRTEVERRKIFEQWKSDISELAQRKNVHTKISGLMMPVLGHCFYQANRTASVNELVHLLSPLIHHAVDCFGTNRILYASNFPMDKPNAKLGDLISAYTQMLQPYGIQALQEIFRDNAKIFYRIDI